MMSDNQIAKLVPAGLDAEMTAKFKKEIADKLVELCSIMDRVNASGFEVHFTIAKQWHGKQGIGTLVLARHF